MKTAAVRPAQAEGSKRKPPTVSELSIIQVRPRASPCGAGSRRDADLSLPSPQVDRQAKAAAHESQKSFLSSLLDESLRAAGLRAPAPPVPQPEANPASSSPAGGSPVLVQSDLVVEDMDEVVGAEWGQGEAKAAREEEEDFVVARSEGVLASRGVLASMGVLASVGVPAVEDMIDDEEEEAQVPDPVEEHAGHDGDRSFIEDHFSSLDERTVNVDPRSSLRLSVSVSHQLKKQIEAALGSTGAPAEPCDGMTTPPSEAPVSMQATPDRSVHVEIRAAAAQV